MPHVIIKLYPGRSEEQKKLLAEAIARDVVSIVQCDEKSVSIAFEEIIPEQWAEKCTSPTSSKRRNLCTRSRDTILLHRPEHRKNGWNSRAHAYGAGLPGLRVCPHVIMHMTYARHERREDASALQYRHGLLPDNLMKQV